MGTKECFVTIDGRMTQFVCSVSQQCCGSECCADSGTFYTHWYFWLAVCMILLVILGFALSAFRHFRKQQMFQKECNRNNTEFNTHLLLNYQVFSNEVFKLPPYEARPSDYNTGQYTPHPCSSKSPYLCLPPPYVESVPRYKEVTSAEDGEERPPSYSECVSRSESPCSLHSVVRLGDAITRV